MTRLFQYECDGCGYTTAKSRSSETPGTFADVEVCITGFRNWRSGGGKELSCAVLLCGDCQIQLSESGDPRKWPRPIKEPADA